MAPITAAATGKPMRKPALGPANTPRPPRPPESSGRPMATSRRNRPVAAAPRRAPSTAPVIMTPSDWIVMGTENPNGENAGTRPRAPMNPAKVAIRARSRVRSCWALNVSPRRGVVRRLAILAYRRTGDDRGPGSVLRKGPGPRSRRAGAGAGGPVRCPARARSAGNGYAPSPPSAQVRVFHGGLTDHVARVEVEV